MNSNGRTKRMTSGSARGPRTMEFITTAVAADVSNNASENSMAAS
jgi:hypothetical protein